MRQGRIDLIWERILLGGQIHGIFSRPLTLGDITIAKYAHYHSPGFYSMIKKCFFNVHFIRNVRFYNYVLK